MAEWMVGLPGDPFDLDDLVAEFYGADLAVG